jgi:hypothetical protein
MDPPAHEDDLYDRWVRQYSEAVKTNLCPYFEWFNLKITDETKTFCKTLPGKYAFQNLLIYNLIQGVNYDFNLNNKLIKNDLSNPLHWVLLDT